MTSTDITELLRSSRPVAPDTLRERVRTIAAAGPAPSPLARFRLPRLRFVVPAVATTALAAAALIAVVRPAHQRNVFEAYTQPATTELTAPPLTSTTATAGQTLSKTDTAPVDHGAAVGSRQSTAPTPASGRAQDYQAQIGIEVKDTDALSTATKRAMTIAQSLGGYVVASQYASSDTGTASITLRVPAVKVQDAIAQLTALGKLTSQQVQIQDLQEQLDQLARDVTVLRGRIAHITALLANPNLTPERRAQLTAQRSQLQTDLRRIRQQSAGVSQQASMATIQLALATKEHSTTPTPASRVHRTLDEAGRILTWEGVALLYGLVVAGPFVLFGALAWVGTGCGAATSKADCLPAADSDVPRST